MRYSEAFDIIDDYHEDNPYPPVDINELAWKLGVKSITPFIFNDENISGFLNKINKKNESEGYTIKVNAKDLKPTQRFTIAHHVANIVLHSTLVKSGTKSDYSWECRKGYFREHMPFGYTLETESNELAAKTLMPAKSVVKTVQDKIQTIESLAKLFHVTENVMDLRLKILLER